MKIENTGIQEIKEIAKAQKEFFESNATLDIKFRKQQLKKLLLIQLWMPKRIINLDLLCA